MRIPLGNFGYGAGAAPVQHSRVRDPGAPVARALQGLGAQMADIAQQREQEDDALNRAKAANALADHELELARAQSDFSTRLASGEVDYNKAGEEWEKVLSRLPPPQSPSDMDPILQETFSGGLHRQRETSRIRVMDAALGAKQADFRNQLREGMDKNEQVASVSGDSASAIARNQALLSLARQGGLDEAQAGAQIAASNERIWTNEVTARINGSDTSIEALQAIDLDLTGENGVYLDKLDPAKRTAMSAQIKNRIDQLHNANRIAADKREAIAERAITQLQDHIFTGTPPSPEMLADISEKVRGTSQEAMLTSTMDMHNEVQRVLRLPSEEQQTYVQQLEARAATQGASPDQRQRLATFKAAIATNEKQLREQPLLFLQNRTGQPVRPIDMAALQSGDPTPVGRAIADRLASLQALRAQMGPQVLMRPLLPQEASLLATTIQRSTPDQAASVFGMLRVAIPDEAGYAAVMAQIAPNDPVAAYAGVIHAKQRQNTGQPGGLTIGGTKVDAGDVARSLLRGRALLNPQANPEGTKGAVFPMPPPKEFAEAFQSEIGNAFAGFPGASSSALESVRAYYAAKSAERGDTSGELDGDLLEDAVLAVVGEKARVNGQDVLPPWGMDADTFETKIVEAWENVIGERAPTGALFPRASPIIPSAASTDLDDYTLRPAGDGQYYLIAAGGQFLHDVRGRPIQIRVKP